VEEQLSAQRIAFVIGKPALAEELACADGDEIRTRDTIASALQSEDRTVHRAGGLDSLWLYCQSYFYSKTSTLFPFLLSWCTLSSISFP